MVVETDWPTSCSGVALSEPSVPISAAGQSTWVADIRNVLSGLSGGHGLGIVYWEPGWVGNANLGSSCAVSHIHLHLQLGSGLIQTRIHCLLIVLGIHVVAFQCSHPLCDQKPKLVFAFAFKQKIKFC